MAAGQGGCGEACPEGSGRLVSGVSSLRHLSDGRKVMLDTRPQRDVPPRRSVFPDGLGFAPQVTLLVVSAARRTSFEARNERPRTRRLETALVHPVTVPVGRSHVLAAAFSPGAQGRLAFPVPG